MTIKTLFAALVLTAAPALATAECWTGHAEQQVMSCADGTTYDADSQTCVPVTTS